MPGLLLLEQMLLVITFSGMDLEFIIQNNCQLLPLEVQEIHLLMHPLNSRIVVCTDLLVCIATPQYYVTCGADIDKKTDLPQYYYFL